MSPERAFVLWLAKRDFMVVKKHRPEVRAHIVKALRDSDAARRVKTEGLQSPTGPASAGPKGHRPNPPEEPIL